MTAESELAHAVEARRAGLESLREGLEEARTSISEFSERVRSDVPTTAHGAVSATFDSAGVLESVMIDSDVLSALSPEEVDAQFMYAFATAPVPAVVLTRLLADPERMRSLRGGSAAEGVTETASERYPLALLTRLGRPTGVRVGAGVVTGIPGEEFGGELVTLARRAVVEAEEATDG